MPRRPSVPSEDDSVRLVSQKGCATLLGVHRDTVKTWIDTGCPTEVAPSGSGEAFVLDIAKVVDWRIRREREKATSLALDQVRKATKSSKAAGGKSPDKEQWDTVKAQAQAGMAVIQEARDRLAVAPIDLMDDMVRERDEKMATALREVEPKVEANLPPGYPRGVVGPIVRGEINSVLNAVKDLSLRDAIGPMVPYDELPDTTAPNADLVDEVMGDADDE